MTRPARQKFSKTSSTGAAGSASVPDEFFVDHNPAQRALLLAGLEVFGEKGLEAATTREISSLAGQNIAAIAYYFENKEGLYLAIARELAHEVALRTGPLLDSIDAQKKLTADVAHHLLRRLVSTIIITMMRTGEYAAFAQFMLREQQQPTAAFELIYEGGIGRVHETLTRLFAAVLKLPPESIEAKIRTHALFGQMLVFRIARALLLRRTGWKDFGPAQMEMIERGVLANVDALCMRDKVRKTRTRKE